MNYVDRILREMRHAQGNDDVGSIGGSAGDFGTFAGSGYYDIGSMGDEEIIGAGLDEIIGDDYDDDDGLDMIMGEDEYDEEDALAEELEIGRRPIRAAARRRARASKLARAASRMQKLREIDPGAIAVRQRRLNRRRRFPLGFETTAVAASTTSGLIPSAPQNLFRVERLVIPSDIAFSLNLIDVKVGNTSQFVSGGEVPAALFTEVAIDTHVHFKTAEIGNVISVQVRNKTEDALEFSAGVIGSVAM